ncbi:hypothetical protein A3SI_09158 [Nitritalea halalkaliphila LW7]|uniref:Uncharacterized protein n=1 Tax=Nitritalea halalkaliphila LW7 TaxID=1189621 RepID=I5C471_9BACT|nr:hypothetical protein [Nitritalea halalkaliphila]EIM76623.1 hypothetical protein A3SI_09158 [Nitritalea halalkaliphila LW7]
MEGNSTLTATFEIPENLIAAHHCAQLPIGFTRNGMPYKALCTGEVLEKPTLYTAQLPQVLDWLHSQERPSALEASPCEVPVLLYEKELSFSHILFHYDGTKASVRLIENFLQLFGPHLTESKATIISPRFTPKSKQREEQRIIEQVGQVTAETSFIKFNFTRIGDFWSYAVQQDCSLLVTTKAYQADLAKVLFHFYKGSKWSDRLSFYLAL